MSAPKHPLLHFATFPILIPGAPSTRPYKVDPQAPATLAMTDFRSAPVVTTMFNTSIDDALNQMKLSGARFAFVVAADRKLVGAITSYDIHGEKPVQYMLSVGCSETTCAWRDVQVENIMVPVEKWYVLEFSQVAAMKVGQVAALVAEAGLRYIVVVEPAADSGARQVRGLFSAARLQMLLGGEVPSPGTAESPARVANAA
jgi:CBS-domain-containing membrane protein